MNTTDRHEHASRYDLLIKLAGFLALAMLLRDAYYFFNYVTTVVREGNPHYLYALELIPRYIRIALLMMVVWGIFKRDEFWGLWATGLLIITILLKDQVITPIHLESIGVPIKFNLNLGRLISILWPVMLGVLLLIPIVGMKNSGVGRSSETWGGAIAAFWNRTRRSIFLFGLLCLGVILPNLSILFPYKVGILLAGVGALAMLDIMGPTKATATGRTRLDAEMKLSKEVDRVETFRLNAFFIALGMVVYGLALMESVR